MESTNNNKISFRQTIDVTTLPSSAASSGASNMRVLFKSKETSAYPMSNAMFRHLGKLRACFERAKLSFDNISMHLAAHKQANHKKTNSLNTETHLQKPGIEENSPDFLSTHNLMVKTLQVVEKEWEKDPYQCLEALLTAKQAGSVMKKARKEKFDELVNECVSLITEDFFRASAPSVAAITQEEIELHLKHVATKDYPEHCPNLDKLARRSSHLTRFIIYKVLSSPLAKERAAIIEMYLHISERAHETQNYRVFYSILQGLNHSSITAILKDHWTYVDPALKKNYDEYSALLFSHHVNNEKYLTEMKNSKEGAVINPDLFLSQLGLYKQHLAQTKEKLDSWDDQVERRKRYAQYKIESISEQTWSDLKAMNVLNKKILSLLEKLSQKDLPKDKKEQLSQEIEDNRKEIDQLSKKLQYTPSTHLKDSIKKLEDKIVATSEILKAEGEGVDQERLNKRLNQLNIRLTIAKEFDGKTLLQVKDDLDAMINVQELLVILTTASNETMTFLISRIDNLKKHLKNLPDMALQYHETTKITPEKRMTGEENGDLDEQFYALARIHKNS